MSVFLYVPIVFFDGHPGRTLHGVWMSRTAAVRPFRTRASRIHSPLRATGADFLRNPGPLSSVSTLGTPLLPFPPPPKKYRCRISDEVTQQVEISDDPVDPFPIVDIPFAASTMSTFRLPLCIRMIDARVEKNFWRGKSANSPLFFEVRIRFFESIEFVLIGLHNQFYIEPALAHK